MSAKIIIHKFGPVEECEFDINKFTVFTGKQASGKSTAAKVVYFFMTIYKDFAAEFSRLPSEEYYDGSTVSGVSKRLRRKFLGVFGSSWAMDSDMRLDCRFTSEVSISVFLQRDYRGSGKNYVEFTYSDKLKKIMSEWDLEREGRNEADSIDTLQSRFSELFDIDYETIYIPSGRGMITILTDQLSYIFSAAEEETQRKIDFCTRDYVTRVLRLRNLFSQGIDGIISDKKHLTQDKIDFDKIYKYAKKIESILKGKYYYVSGEERLYINSSKYVKINYASSGQQEIIWVLNIIFNYIFERKKVFLIVEEPEAHLYPDGQKAIAELLSMFYNSGNIVMITTHSPYILGQINNMLLAEEVSQSRNINKVISKDHIIKKNDSSAYYVRDGRIFDAFDNKLIDNALIDGASKEINEQADSILELIWEKKDND